MFWFFVPAHLHEFSLKQIFDFAFVWSPWRHCLHCKRGLFATSTVYVATLFHRCLSQPDITSMLLFFSSIQFALHSDESSQKTHNRRTVQLRRKIDQDKKSETISVSPLCEAFRGCRNLRVGWTDNGRLSEMSGNKRNQLNLLRV